MSSLLTKIASFTLGSILLYGICQAAPQSIPNFKAEYVLKHNNIEIGHVTLTVKQTATNTYRLVSATKTSGLLAFIRDDDVVETSQFEIHENKPRPLNYQYKEHLGDGEKNVTLTFDWNTLYVSNASKGHIWKLPISIGVLDKALMQIALMRDLSTTENSLSYQIADGGRLKNYVFTRRGTEDIIINDKPYSTIKLARKKDDKPLITYYWCAPELYNLPILLQRRKTYGTFEMRLIKASFATTQTEHQ